MTLSLKVFGYEVARIDFDSEPAPAAAKPLDRGIKTLSRWWVNRGMQ